MASVVLLTAPLYLALLAAVIVSLVITNKKNLRERPVWWATCWVSAWAPFTLLLFVYIAFLL